MQRIPTQKGVAIVEFTIVLPLLLLLMLAIAEFGRALYQYNTLIKAVRDGARFMSENAFLGDSQLPNDTARLTEVKQLVAYGAIGAAACGAYGACQDLPGFTTAQVNTPTLYQDAAGDYYVTVSSSGYTYQPMLGNLLPLTSIGMNIPLQASTTMRVL
ncbi:MAG: TadE/TadG family type IV pilus assembly protein [Gammaproteobacteria bacterium]